MDQFKLYLKYKMEVSQAKLQIVERLQQQDRRQPKQRTSNIDIVQNVLNSEGTPLHLSDIIQMSQKKYDVRLNRDSIISAIPLTG